MTVFKITNTVDGEIQYAFDRKEVRALLHTSHPTMQRLFNRFRTNKIALCLDHVVEKVEVDQDTFKCAVMKSLASQMSNPTSNHAHSENIDK